MYIWHHNVTLIYRYSVLKAPRNIKGIDGGHMASIRKRKNSYQITVSNGRDVFGKQILEFATFVPDPTKTNTQNKKALERFVLDFEDKVKSGNYLSGDKICYKDYVDLWLKDYAIKQLQQTTIERCESSLNKIVIPAIGHLKLSKIQPLHIQKLYDDIAKTGYNSNGKIKMYSSNTIKRIHQIISSTLSTAVQWQLIDSNPCSRVKPPKIEKQADVKHFTLEQTNSFIEYLNKPYKVSYCGRTKKDGSPSDRHYETRELPTQFKLLFKMALFGGFRRGELIALTWQDIDFKSYTINIDKSSARTKNGVVTKSPKTYSSIRTVVLPKELINELKLYKTEQQRYRLSIGTYWEGDNYLFIQDNGKQMDLSTPNKVFKKVINRYNANVEDKNKLPEITLHGLRHTSATLLISENIDVKTVSKRLGHSECSTTMDIYAHALQKKDEVAAITLENILNI